MGCDELANGNTGGACKSPSRNNGILNTSPARFRPATGLRCAAIIDDAPGSWPDVVSAAAGRNKVWVEVMVPARDAALLAVACDMVNEAVTGALDGAVGRVGAAAGA